MDARIVVWGAGAMGGSIGAWLHRAGHDVLFVDQDEAHVRAINDKGLEITGPVDAFTVRVPAMTPAEMRSRRDAHAPASGGTTLHTVLLAVKAHHTERAVEQLAPSLAEDGFVVSVQNGLNERVIARCVGLRRTVGCFVNFGADVMEPGVIQRGNRGAVVVGELDGARTERIVAVHALFRDFDDRAVLTENIQGYLWSKLAYGSLLFATALAEASIADVLDSREHRPTLIALGREVVRVALARGIRPEAFDGFDPAAFRPDASDDAAAASLDRLVGFNRESAKSHSGVWRDLAVRKRKTEVDAQIAVLSELGTEVGVATPLVDRLVALIHDVEQGRRVQGWDTVDALGSVHTP